ncbi:MnmC family methyltransferase [Helicobacter sp.]|uniref:MnmC family methyltransferase n=1 Tax=Helicobacter sp. TaxID=218 RepID=UPI0025BC39DD|nr:MnmC family methyltransferase [Helicobacter sp.]MCI5969028.1 MnmC family methyltransferase [Helicobacter sp.]MDY2585324.1 MnmC family methyltransferase [Helicobacter sp.]
MQILTKDASITLYSAYFNEAYHSINDGALQETLHKHILPAVALKLDSKKLESKMLNVLDICFGLGFNTLSLYSVLKKRGFNGVVCVDSPELELLENLKEHPYPKELASAKEVLCALEKKRAFKKGNFSIKLHLGDAREILKGFLAEIQKSSKEKFNVVFQDPFSPLKNHYLWTYEYFKMLYALSSDDVVVTTYSCNSCMLYSAFLAGFYAFKVVQKNVRDSVVLTKTKDTPRLDLEFVEKVVKIDIEHKIRVNSKLKGLYD